jgi:hypothetical protein
MKKLEFAKVRIGKESDGCTPATIDWQFCKQIFDGEWDSRFSLGQGGLKPKLKALSTTGRALFIGKGDAKRD